MAATAVRVVIVRDTARCADSRPCSSTVMAAPASGSTREEASGVITDLGQGVQGWAVGQRVCALLDGGGYAEQVSVPVRGLLPVPGQGPTLVWRDVTETTMPPADRWALALGDIELF